ncbi:MAG: YjfI family protein [Xanthomonadaceae bacterium]|nr:YjfI family protein [Xanthomonadaceae bacterium]
MSDRPPSSPSPEALRQARFRERMKDRGLKPVTLHVRPQYHSLLKSLEKRMQRDNTPPSLLIAEIDSTMSTPQAISTSAASAVAPHAAWTARPLFDALQPHLTRYGMTAELIDGSDPTIHIVVDDDGELDVTMAVSGEQIFVSVPLVTADDVSDIHGLNDACLRMNPINPLSNLGIVRQGDGRDVYIVFGELSSRSPVVNVLEEIRVLADNALDAAEAISPFLGAHAPLAGMSLAKEG